MSYYSSVLSVPSRSLLIGFIALLLCFCHGTMVHAQISRHSIDSANGARKLVLDSTRAAQKANLEAMRTARQHTTDSMREARQKLTDSLTAIRKYRESRHYRDSVTRSREDRVAAIRDASKARMDSMKDARQHVSDSMIAARKAGTEILRTTQKRRTDSLTAIRKYRESKRYADSVTVMRRVRLDSLKAERKTALDALTATRKASLDSMKAVRKAFTDSLTAVRKVHTDSLKAVRKVKADALAKAKTDKAKTDKVKEKAKLDNMSLKINLARKKQQEKWDNTKMLKKKWSTPRKVIQNTFTRFNYYFNANRKMEEAVANMQRLGKDDYDKNIPLFSFDPSKDSARFSADMDSVIQKASLGIQIHDPRGKWEDDLYLLLGQAYYFKGNFEQASNAFRYIVAVNEKMKADEAKKKASRSGTAKRKEEPSFVTKEDKSMLAFLKHTPANNDALLWLARTYTQSGQLSASESVLDLLSSDSKFPEDLKGRLALEKAFYDLASNNTKDAAVQLAVVSDDKSQPSFIRRRAAYLDGQLLQQQGSWAGAAKQFETVTDLNPKIDMDFYARKSRAYSLMQAGEGTGVAIASLRGMLGDNKYLAYQEQVYYLLGQLSAGAKNVDDAEKYFGQGLASVKTTKKQRAVTFAALGNLYYSTGDYQNAKRAYDSAAKMSASAADDPSVKTAVARSKVLDKVSSPAGIIHTQDSLLALSTLSEKEQRAVVRRYLRSLNRAANAADNAGDENGAVLTAAQNQNEDAGNDGALSWYFTNPQLLLQGNNEFKRKWGNRPLADNWRRASAISQNSNVFAADSGTTRQRGLTANGNDDPRTGRTGQTSPDISENSLLAAIPNSEAQKGIATNAIQRAYVDLATAYLRQLDDYTRATATLDTLDRRYPNHPHKPETIYLRYLVALKNNNLPAAQGYSSKLLQEYGNTQWAALVRPANEDGSNNGPLTASVSDYYDETYGMMMQRQWTDVLSRARTGRQRYTDETYGNRFKIMEAIALAGQGQYSFADSMLSEFLRVHPSDSLHSWAEGALNFIQKQRAADTLHKPAIAPLQNTGSLGNTVLKPVDTVAITIPAEFTYEPNTPHYSVFLFQHMESKALGVRAGTDDFNRLKVTGGNTLSAVLIPIMQGGEGMVVTKSFKNAAAAKAYLQKWRSEPVLTREYKPVEYKTFIISEANYRKLIADKNSAAYFSFYSRRY